VASVLEELGAATASAAAAHAEVEALRVDAAELEELREMKADVERKERQQAAIILEQGRRLEELDKLYREEVGRGKEGLGLWKLGP
jgi:hypothetical protein